MENASVGRIKKIGTIQTIAEMSVPAENAREILSMQPSAYVRVSETLTGEVRLSGRETLTVVYLSDDGAKSEVCSVDFTARAEIDGVTPSQKVYAMGKVFDTEVVSMGGGIVKLASVIEITIYAEEKCELPELPTADNGVFVCDEAETYSNLVAVVHDKSTHTTERITGGEFLCAEARTCIKGCDAILDGVEIYGNIIVEGLQKGAEGNLSPFSVTLPLSEELQAEGARRGDKVKIEISSISVSEEENEDGFILNIVLSYFGCVYSDVTLSCVSDAYSPESELELNKKIITGERITDCQHFTEQINETVTLGEGENADRVLAVTGVDLTSLTAREENGKAVIEGVIIANVIYSDVEADKKKATLINLPFGFTSSVELSANDQIDVYGRVGNISVRPSRVGELSVKAELHMHTVKSHAVEMTAVIGYKQGAERNKKEGVISMRVGRENETLWDVAKSLLVSPDEIVRQNPDVTFPLKKGDKIFVFRAKV
ncbi:MAG: hypothetical protein IKM44_03525 [Clostridia bacterium]|nr:hypothetical protein [Clostridia bacterium]